MLHMNNNGGGIGFFGVLTIVFIVLKLTGAIAWSWWWVLSPCLIPLSLAFLIGCAVCLFVDMRAG